MQSSERHQHIWSRLIILSIISFISINCNKNSNQLPTPKAPPSTISIPAKLNGINLIDFIFQQEIAEDSSKTSLFIRNNTNSSISDLQYIVEICTSENKNFENCSIQLNSTLQGILAPGAKSKVIYTWSDQFTTLNVNSISVGIIHFNEIVKHPLANVYSNVSTMFEGDNNYLSAVRGYILADGNSTFRYKTVKNNHYNLEGLFTPDKRAFGGVISDDSSITSNATLDPIDPQNPVIDSSGTLRFRVKLTPALDDSTRTILTFLKKYF